MDEIQIRPQPGRQTQFLASKADVTVYGGAAGGGKTWGLLLEPLRHVKNKDFGAVIFRRTMPEITHEGALWDEAQKLYPLLGAWSNENERTFTFPWGSRITFSHMQREDDKFAWKSAQVPLLEFDQLETFSETQFFYMLTRNRSLCGVQPYVRASANPEPGWLADFLGWWIADDGYADLARVGRLRWMARVNEEIRWGNTRQELVERHGAECLPKSVTFIVSTIYDNQILLAKDPGYLGNLKAQNLIDRERLLGDPKRGGNWKIKPAAGKLFNREWFEIVDAVPGGGVECRFWDFAATKKTLKKKDPDSTASVDMVRVNGAFYILDVTEDQEGPAEVETKFVNLSKQDAQAAEARGAAYKVRWEEEPGSAAKRDSLRLAQMLAGLDAAGVPPKGDKITRAKPLAAQAQVGNVKLLKGKWNARFIEHMHNQPEWPHDDIMDGASGSFDALTNDLEGAWGANPFASYRG